MNNGQYVRIAQRLLPSGFRPTVLRAEFKRQSFLGDVLIPRVLEEDQAFYVEFADAAGETSFVAESAK